MNPRVKQLAKRVLAWGLPDWPILRWFYRNLWRAGVVVYEVGVWLKKVFLVEPTVRALATRVGKRLRVERIPYLRQRGRLIIGNDVEISGKIGIAFNTALGLDPELVIGNHTFIGHQCSFSIARSIRIGDHCLIAGGTSFADNDGHPVDPVRRRAGERVAATDVRPIVVGDDVWIGAGCRILKGVTIGDRAIVGAGSIVTQDVPADTIVAGNPARPIRKIESSNDQAKR